GRRGSWLRLPVGPSGLLTAPTRQAGVVPARTATGAALCRAEPDAGRHSVAWRPVGSDVAIRQLEKDHAKAPLRGALAYLAGRGGFEPPRRYKRLPDFESGT